MTNNKSETESPPGSTYLLHLWRDGKGQAAWRASLKDVRTQHSHKFHKLSDLETYLRPQLELLGECGDSVDTSSS